MERIDRLRIRAFRVPTEFPESDGTLKWDATTIVLVQVSAGKRTGLGYTYSQRAAAALISDVMRSEIVGSDPFDIPLLIDRLKHITRNLGVGGLVTQAISAIDVALWDLKARLLDIPLVKLLGAARENVPVYGSGGFTSYSLEQLTDQLSGWVAQGISRVKMKVGRHPDADHERVRAARKSIGPETELFVDANGAYSRQQALQKANEFMEQGVCWFEEPVSSDDLDGLRLIRDRSPAGMDIAAGEYGDRPVYFQRMLLSGGVDVQMADATRCGGISGFLEVAGLCRGAQLPLSAHTAPNLHAHVCAALSQVRHIEYFHDHVRLEQMFFDGALTPIRGEFRLDEKRPGLGLQLKEPDINQYEV